MNANDEIIAWLNKQHEWIQEAACRLLDKGELDELDVSDFVALIKSPGPPAGTPRKYPSIAAGSAASTELRLDAIGPVVGIDALNPRTPLGFGSGNLTVVYGTNGSGKSGYTRIITKACGKPHSMELKPNVYQSAPAKRECTFDYTLGGTKKTAVWLANAEPLNDLISVDVFDTDCGRFYLERDLVLSYEPTELALFSNLVDACKKVEAVLASEQRALVSKLPEIPAKHAATIAGKSYAALSKDITAEAFNEMLEWSAGDETILLEQRERLQIADPTTAAKAKREIKVRIDAVRSALNQAVKALGEDTRDFIRSLETDAAAKRKAATEGAKALDSTTVLNGIGKSTWKAMWEAARAYSIKEAYPDFNFPNTGSEGRCVLCHQDLDEKAKRRLNSFEKFVKGSLESDATEAEKLLVDSLAALPVRPDAEALIASCQAAWLSETMQNDLESAWAKLEVLLDELREGNFIQDTSPTIEPAILSLLSNLEKLSIATEALAKDLAADAISDDRIQTRENLSESEGRKWVTEQATSVRSEVVRLQQWSAYDEWQRKTSTTGISRKAGELSEVLITEAYIQRFNDELKKLGANKLQVELVKTATSYGRSKHGIRLQDVMVDGIRVSEVLSEGERRIVALAAFLADVTSRESSSPFVFDDPISSLDQGFEEKVIARLIELSKDRQVLVFTHRLSFLGIMNELASGALHDVHIRREPWGTGQPGDIPLFGKKPDKALNSLKCERIAKARKIYEADGYDYYYPQAKSICSDFRILMERIVETVFLADVIQRHRRAVNTMGKIGNLVKIGTADCDLIDEMMTKYSCYEHSQSDEAPVDVPDPDQIEADIDRMIKWHKEFTGRAS
jgi:hypothetical protein